MGRASVHGGCRPHITDRLWEEEHFIDPLFAAFRPRRADVREFALRYRVVLIEADNGTPLDVALGAVPFEIDSVQRATPFPIGDDRVLITCSSDDLLVHKVIANREKDWS